jgi:hypothetical protein
MATNHPNRSKQGYKLTADFNATNMHGQSIAVRDINYTPDDRRLPDVAVCRIFSSRDEAQKILAALRA